MLIEGLSVTKAAQQLQVARSAAFRWRNRFLHLPQQMKGGHFDGIVEADETGWLKSCKGQRRQRQLQQRPARHRGGNAKARGLFDEYDIALMVRDCSGACADQIVKALDTAHLAAVLQPVLAAAARHINVEHPAIKVSAGEHAREPWYINNLNGHHSRLKTWLRRFSGVASSYLTSYLGWFLVLERFRPVALTPMALLALAVGV